MTDHCRDCADNFGTCPYDGKPCDPGTPKRWGEFKPPKAQRDAPTDAELTMESALAELINKIDSGLDTGDIIADAGRASAALDAILAGGDLVANAYDHFKQAGDEQPSVDFRIGWNACLDAIATARARHAPAEDPELQRDAAAYRRINTPEIANFLSAVQNEALHQREHWGAQGDAGKTDGDWFWLLGYLGGKAIRPDATPEKRLHHIITTAAACLNWHGARIGTYMDLRPGIAAPDAALGDAKCGT